MTTLRIPISAELDEFLAREVAARGYANAGEYVQALLSREKDLATLRGTLLAGAESPLSPIAADAAYFEGLRQRARQWAVESGGESR